MNNLLTRLQLPRMFIVLTLLGVYSASMYKIASVQSARTNIIDIPITATAADMEKILDVVEPRIQKGPTSTYFPGVACVIDAGPQSTVEEMQEYFSTCLQVHEDFMSSSTLIE